MLPPKKPSLGFSSILTQKTISSKKSLGSIIKDVKKSMPDASPSQYKKMAQTIYKLNTNPNAVVTNRMTRSVIQNLNEAGHLKRQFKNNIGSAITHVKKTHEEANERTPEDKRKDPHSYEEKKEARKAEVVKKRRMLSRARAARREAEEAQKVTKLGLEEWQDSNVSIGQAIKDKERERQQAAEDSMTELSRKAIDMMID